MADVTQYFLEARFRLGQYLMLLWYLLPTPIIDLGDSIVGWRCVAILLLNLGSSLKTAESVWLVIQPKVAKNGYEHFSCLEGPRVISSTVR